MSSAAIATKLAHATQYHEQGELAQAINLYEQIIATEPRHSDAQHLLGVAALQQGNTQSAIKYFQQAININPGMYMAHANLANALVMDGRLAEALRHYDHALQLRPDFSGALFNRGNALMALQQPQQALASYERLLKLEPNSIEALNNRGQALIELRRIDEALRSFDQALALMPDYCPALNNRANALLELGRAQDALASCNQALAFEPDYAQAHYNRGIALLDLRRPEEALASYDRALALRPDYTEALTNRATTLLMLRRPQEALTNCEQALSLQQDDAEALNVLGSVMLDLNHPERALDCFDGALQLRNNFTDALNNRASTLLGLGRHTEAAAAFSNLLKTHPDYDYAMGRMLHAQRYDCDWSDYAKTTQAIVQDVSVGKRAELPFSMLALSDSPELQLRCARTYVADKHPPATPIWKGQRYQHKRIRIAYISADFRDHAVAHSLAGILEKHDRMQFEIIGVSLRSESVPSEIGKRISGAFEQFFDVSLGSDYDVAMLLANLQVDIAVDLNGHTAGSRLGILAFRPAPIQVSYLGYPGSMGADYIDYLIADSVIVPEADEAAYAERIVRLPHSFFPADRSNSSDLTMPTRSAVGLPEQGIVFCAFNNTYKLSPATFSTWMDILCKVPNSVLWLREFNPTAIANLRSEASTRGVAAQRLIFAPKLTDKAAHLARQQLADLFLDTLPYNAHTTASDALSVGLPVLTCMGNTYTSRVAASLLQAIGLPELITRNLADYSALAQQLAIDPAMLAGIRNKLAANLLTKPLFDTDRYCRDLERAYTMMWQRHQDGEASISFSVAVE